LTKKESARGRGAASGGLVRGLQRRAKLRQEARIEFSPDE
jgi:hypothetical protein